jgi:diacylglycerol kinase family enzyme
MRVLLIHNPKAGDDDHAREHLVELANAAGHEVTYVRSRDEWQPRLDAAPELVVVAGGDGTVAEVARAMAGREIALTILPTGTANNIARALGIADLEHDALVAGWTRGILRPFDLGIASGPWGRTTFLESVGIGVLADLMAEIDEGDSGYVNELGVREQRLEAAIDVLRRIVSGSSGVHCALDIDGQRVSGEYLLVEVLNFGAAGPNLRLAPGADAGDGRLDVVLVGASDRGILTRHLQGDEAEPQLTGLWQVHQASQIRLQCEGAPLHIDDELWARDSERLEIIVEVEPGALRFLVPGR